MNTHEITRLQEEADMAYNHVYQSEAAPWLQATLLAEIALQLQKQNTHLESIAKSLDAFRINGLPIENIH